MNQGLQFLAKHLKFNEEAKTLSRFETIFKLCRLSTNTPTRFLLACFFILFFGSIASAQTLGVYAFTGASACPVSNPNVTAQPANATFSTYTNTGANCVSIANLIMHDQWTTGTTLVTTEYNQFTITPAANYLLALTSLTFTHQTSENATTGNTTWVLRSSLDGYTTDIGTGTATTTSQTPTITLPAGTFTNVGAVTFRLYLYRARQNSTTWRNDNVTLNGTVVAAPANPGNPTSNSPQCSNPGVTITRTGTPPANVTWYWQTTASGTATLNSGVTYTAIAAGTYYIRARHNTSGLWSAGAGSVAVTMSPNVAAPVFTLGSTSNRCAGAATITYTATSANSTGITYSLDGVSILTGSSINSATGQVSWSALQLGTATITATATGCNGPTSSNHTVNVDGDVATPVFSLGVTSTRCQAAGNVTYTATANNASLITYTLDATSISGGNSINPANGVVTYAAGWSGTSTISASAQGCNGPKTSDHTVTITPIVSGLLFASGPSSDRCQAVETITYSASATNTTGITYTLDAGSISGGNTINPLTGDVVFSATWVGTTTVTATAAGCSPLTATHIILTRGPVAVPIFALGSTSTRCKNGASEPFTATATYATSISYSLDAASIAGGNTINPGTGVVTFDNNYVGNSTITATANGCYGPQNQTHTVTTSDDVEKPVFLLGNSSERCQGGGSATYTATALNSTSIVYSLNATGIAGGNTINPSTGAVTFNPAWIGKFKVKATATGCDGPEEKEHEIETKASVTTPVFKASLSPTRCQEFKKIKYDADSDNETSIVYSLDVISLAAGNTINSSDGEVTFSAAWSGNSTITATAYGDCGGPFSTTFTVTTNPPVTTPIFSSGPASTKCQSEETITYTASSLNTTGITYTLDAASIAGGNSIVQATGVVTFSATWFGTTTITASAAGCFGPLIATHTVTVNPTIGTPSFTLGATSNRCQALSSVIYTATAANTTNLTYALDAASSGAGNTINPLTGEVIYDANWVGISTITVTANGCGGPKTATHTVTTNAPVTVPVFNAGPATVRCQGAGTITYSATAANTTGITYMLDGGSASSGNSINAATGAVTWAASWSGSSTITASAAGCYGPKNADFVVTITPTVSTPVFAPSVPSRCQGGISIFYTATAANSTSITYSIDGASVSGGNSINATTGELTFSPGYSGLTTVTATAAGCNGPRTSTYNIITTATVGTPIFSLGATSTRCQAAGTQNYSATATTNTGLAYSLDQGSLDGGNSINSANGWVTYVGSWSGTSVITATAQGCNGPSTASHTVTITPVVVAPVFNGGSVALRCQGGATLSYAATAQNTTGITYSISPTGGGNSINSSTGDVTFAAGYFGTLNVIATAAGCSPQSTSFTVVTTATVGLPVFSMGATSSRCHAAGDVTYTATATTTTGISYSLDAASLAGGNTINSSNGTVTYVDSWVGTTVITASAAGCNGPRTATHTVTVNGSVTTPVFALGSSSVRCQSTLDVTYNATANNTTGLTYSLDAASLAGGNTIASGSGFVNWNVNWTGTSTVTVSAAGCYGPLSSTHTISTTPYVTTPVFAIGNSSTRCQGAGVVAYSATASFTTGITYSLNGASITGGCTIDANTGEVTYPASWSGTTTITASAAGCSGPQTRTHTVTVTPTVGTPVFSLGASSTRCQTAVTVTYTATASNSTSREYFLDATSTAAGNFINSTNGAVAFTAEWVGTSVITVVAQGCNGPSTSSHTVTTTASVTTPVFAMGSSSIRCRLAETITYTATSTNTTGITYSLDFSSLFAGNTINTATGAVTYTASWTGTSTITARANGCNGPDFSSHTVTTRSIVTTPVFSMDATSTRCQGAATITYSASASFDTAMIYTLNAPSLAAGNTINSSTGTVTYVAGYSGTTIITVNALGCSPKTATHTVTVNPTVTAPIFTNGTTSTRCNGENLVSYPATAGTAITFTLNAAAIAGGNTINSSSGTVSYAAGWSGTAIITATATGCGTPTATHTAISTPSVSPPVFAMGATSSRCQGAGNGVFSATSSNSTGIMYTLNSAALSAGNTINNSTGDVTFVASWSGATVITATSYGCNGPATSTHSVVLSGNGTPTFALGANSARVQAAEDVTYSALSNNGNPVTFTLDATSLAAGNTINSATGVVSYALTWFGTSIITGTATGCNGSASSTHTVVTRPSSVIKQLYFNSTPAQSLDRVDPVATLDGTTSTTAAIATGATTTFTQSLAVCSPLIIKIGRNIVVRNYITISSGSMPANPNITAVIKHGTTTIITLSNPTYSGGLLTWTGAVASDVTVPAGEAISIDITNNQPGVSFIINYDSQTRPSAIDLPVSTYIEVMSLDVYNAPYPGGTIIDRAVAGTTSYIRAVVSDPFGFSDITALNLTFTPPGNVVAATSVATSGCDRTYEYVWNSPAIAGYVDITALAKEGYENTVTATRNVAFSNCTDCPPLAVRDFATGAGGTPILINVLANDTDPNDNINPSSLTVLTVPQNGNAIISGGQIVYLPNGTFAGVDSFTYQICDLTTPTALCASATVVVTIDPTIVDPCAESAEGHVYYIPYPEQDARNVLISSSGAAFLPIPSNNIRTIISASIPYPGMRVIWDHWEDGYEGDIQAPTQSTTLVWGDGNVFNGIAPGYPTDVFPSGASLIFDNTMPANPRNPANFFYDGKDKIHASSEITVTQVLGEPSIIGVQSMKTNVSSLKEFGQQFTIPVGENFNSQDFRHTALFIRASANNTVVNVDKDNNGTFETTATLNEGQNLIINGDVLTGATVTGSKPIGVDLHFGGVDGYSSREVPIFPATWYSNVYYTPVPTTASPDTAVVMLYNNLNRPININWTSGAPASGTILLPAKTVVRFPLAVYTTSAYKFVNPSGESFTAIEVVDSYTPGGGGNSGSTFDWAFNLIAEQRLTTFATIAWAPGSTDNSRNDNPIWVTPASNTTLYVKYNGNVLSGGLLSPCGLRYDATITLNALKFTRLRDSDNNNSGLAVYTCDGTRIAAVYGEDPSTALDANPSWDVGSTIKPFCSLKLIFANDDYAYTITNQAVTIPILQNDTGFLATIDRNSVTIASYYMPLHGQVSINSNGTLLYTPNAGYVGLDTLYYNVCSTPSPVVCDMAMVIINISGCPSPVNQNIISGQVFLDKNKDGISNDDSTGFAGVKVYLYADGNCDGVAAVNELKDSVTVDAGGYYQFISLPEKTVSDDFSTAAGASSCASGSDGTAPWLTNWVDAGDAYTGYCDNDNAADVDIFTLSGNFALRLKDNDVSATRTVNLSGATAAFLNFRYRRTTAFASSEDVRVQVSTNGSSFTTIFTISGSGAGITDAAYVNVYNLDLRPYASANTYIRFVTDTDVDDADIIYIDDVSINYLQYPMCYITKIDPTTINVEYYASNATQNALTVNFGGSCAFQYNYGMAKKIISISGTLFNDANGLTDGLVNGTPNGAPAGNTVYAYLVNTLGKVELKTAVNSVAGTYTFTQAEVGTNYTIVLSTTEVAVGANPPSTANLPTGWVAVGDAYGTINGAGSGNEVGTPNLAIPVNTGLFSITGVNFGIEQLPTAGNGYNEIINPGGTISATVPSNTFSNIQVSTDVAVGTVAGIRISAFPPNATSITINGTLYTSATFPGAGVIIPADASGQPSWPILVDPVNGFLRVTIPFFARDNAGRESLLPGAAVIKFLLDNDRDGRADIYDIDDDNDGITDVIEVCGLGATSFSCAPGGLDPANDADDDGILNYKDIDLGTLNANGAITTLDYDDDGVPDFFDLDTDNDGIPDVVEAYGVDENGDGVIDNFTDTDADGLSQNVDANNSGVAGSGTGLGFRDLDGDGVPNTRDLDSDNDGIPDIIEAGGVDANNNGTVDVLTDTDADGLVNALDGDADNNNTIENLTGPLLKTGADTDGDGVANSHPNKNADYIGYPNPYDLDADGDGLSDAIESGITSITISNSIVTGGRTKGWSNIIQALATLPIKNVDGRGNPDYLDIDSDDDGITDNIEGFPTYSYKILSDTDSDNDGLSDVYELAPGAFGGSSITPYDHDADGTPDYMDTDTDNDGAPDLNEGSNYQTLTQGNINNADLDGDGLLDEFDIIDVRTLAAGFIYRNSSSNNMGTNGNFNGPTPSGSNVKIIKSQLVGGDRDFRNAQILPLHIVSFSGSLNDKMALLKWKAENQLQVDYYVIERSFNGQQFTEVGSVDAIIADTYTYSYNDDLSQSTAVNVYYRIKEVNKNGEIFYSSIVVLKPGRQIFVDLRVYPNPAHEVVNITLNSSVTDEVEINMIDALGKTVVSKKFIVVNGSNTYVIPEIAKLQNGLYILVIKTKEDSWSQKIIKQ